MFALCSKCATEFSNTTCEHQDQDRIISGTWVTLEVYKAVELGYKVIKIEEVWHWLEKTNDIFKSYINFAIKGNKIFFTILLFLSFLNLKTKKFKKQLLKLKH
jgi:hypothetical protein